MSGSTCGPYVGTRAAGIEPARQGDVRRDRPNVKGSI